MSPPCTKNDEQAKWHFFLSGFLSQTFTIHKTAGEGEGYLYNSCLPLLLCRHLEVSRAITVENSLLHIVNSPTLTVKL